MDPAFPATNVAQIVVAVIAGIAYILAIISILFAISAATGATYHDTYDSAGSYHSTRDSTHPSALEFLGWAVECASAGGLLHLASAAAGVLRHVGHRLDEIAKKE